MKHLSTDYNNFINNRLNEVIDQDKISGLKDRLRTLDRRLTNEKDPNRKRKLQIEVKICQLKIELAQIP